MNRLVSFLLVLAILGIIIGALNKGARAIGFFIALLAIVLLIGTPGSGNLNFFANLLNGEDSTQTGSYNTGAGGTGGAGTASTPQTTGAPQAGASQPSGAAQTAGTSSANPRDLPAQAPAGTASRPTTGTGSTGTGNTARYGTGTSTSSARNTTSSGRPRALW